MKFSFLTLALVAVMGLSTSSCAEGSDTDRAAENMANETEQSMRDFGAEINDESRELSNEFKEARMNVDKRMTAIEADLENAAEDSKAKLQEEWNNLEQMGKNIDSHMDRVGDNMEAGWKNFKGDVKIGWKDFSNESNKLLKDVERATDPESDLD